LIGRNPYPGKKGNSARQSKKGKEKKRNGVLGRKSGSLIRLVVPLWLWRRVEGLAAGGVLYLVVRMREVGG